jgi:hypothetical protein
MVLAAALSPTPPLLNVGGNIGGVVVGVVGVVGSVALAFTKTSALLRLKILAAELWPGDPSQAGNLLFYQGVSGQVGSFVGSGVMFVLVNVLHVFRELPKHNQTNHTNVSVAVPFGL